ncbi:hypothetical protein QBC38DRAFT_460124 [Podospora fimiseda]|uniref:Uncharacterized protein n=1 Tax=Podospora fimiseda TaxID=252190 RepID=A0AAN6YTS9_9PEZI|nr:hypothetical protein QBC38DRAFT_460124 [Podospora fimiseda]
MVANFQFSMQEFKKMQQQVDAEMQAAFLLPMNQQPISYSEEGTEPSVHAAENLTSNSLMSPINIARTAQQWDLGFQTLGGSIDSPITPEGKNYGTNFGVAQSVTVKSANESPRSEAVHSSTEFKFDPRWNYCDRFLPYNNNHTFSFLTFGQYAAIMTDNNPYIKMEQGADDQTIPGPQTSDFSHHSNPGGSSFVSTMNSPIGHPAQSNSGVNPLVPTLTTPTRQSMQSNHIVSPVPIFTTPIPQSAQDEQPLYSPGFGSITSNSDRQFQSPTPASCPVQSNPSVDPLLLTYTTPTRQSTQPPQYLYSSSSSSIDSSGNSRQFLPSPSPVDRSFAVHGSSPQTRRSTSPITEPFPSYRDPFTGKIYPPFQNSGRVAGNANRPTPAPARAPVHGLPAAQNNEWIDPTAIFNSTTPSKQRQGLLGFEPESTPEPAGGGLFAFRFPSNIAHRFGQQPQGQPSHLRSAASGVMSTEGQTASSHASTPASLHVNKPIHPDFRQQYNKKPHIELRAKFNSIPDMPTDAPNGNPYAPRFFELLPAFRNETTQLIVTGRAPFIGQLGLLFDKATFALSRLPVDAEHNIVTRWTGKGVATFMAAHGMHSGREDEVWALNLRIRDWPAGQVARFPESIETAMFLKQAENHFVCLPHGKEVWYKTGGYDPAAGVRFVKVVRAFVDTRGKDREVRMTQGEDDWEDEFVRLGGEEQVALVKWAEDKPGVVVSDAPGYGAIKHMTAVRQPTPGPAGAATSAGPARKSEAPAFEADAEME